MKANILIAVTTLLMGSGLALAAGETQDHKAHHPESAGTTAPEAPATSGDGMPMMQEHMQKMHAQMEEIHRTGDPDKRDELIQTHMDSMSKMMKMMQGMHSGKPMMGGPQGEMMEMMNRQQMTDQRMDMMQMMMDQMMQHQAATEATRKQRHDHGSMK